MKMQARQYNNTLSELRQDKKGKKKEKWRENEREREKEAVK